MKLRSYRPSAGVLVALTALFFAVGGVGYAKKAVNLISGSEIKKGSIGVAQLSPAALAALRGQSGAPGPQGGQGPKGDPGPQGPKGDPGQPATRLWARVGADGTLENGSPGVTSTRRTLGWYSVTFPQDVSSCGSTASRLIEPGDRIDDILVMPDVHVVSSPNEIRVVADRVVATNTAPTGAADTAFSLAVFC